MGNESEPWAAQVRSLLERAAEAFDAGHSCEGLIDQAFELVDREGSKEHPMFGSLVCFAADVAESAGATDAAAALYKRAYDVWLPFGSQANAFVVLALCGLARADVARNWLGRARERYTEALNLLDKLDHPDEHGRRTQIAQALEALTDG